MSDWEFLYGLKGEELEFAMSHGYTMEEAPYVEAELLKYTLDEFERIISNSNLETTPVIDAFSLQRPDVDVYIDAENISSKNYERIRVLLGNIGAYGRVTAYALQKDGPTKNWHTQALKFDELREKRLCGAPQKNKCDNKIMKDMKEATEQLPPWVIIVLVTSDADFLPAVRECRQKGFLIVGIGEKKAPQKLRKAYTRFIELPE